MILILGNLYEWCVFLFFLLTIGFGARFLVPPGRFISGYAFVRGFGNRSAIYLPWLGFLGYTEPKRVSLFRVRVRDRLKKQDQLEDRRQDDSWPPEPFRYSGCRLELQTIRAKRSGLFVKLQVNLYYYFFMWQ